MTEPLDLSPKPAPIPEATPTPTEGKLINSGYNTQNTSSYLETPKSSVQSPESITELQQNDKKLDFNSFLSASLKHRVEAFHKTLAEVNASFFNQYKDNTLAILEGATTLIMFLGGSLHGFKVASALNSVLNNDSNQKNKISKEQKKTAIEGNIKKLDESINEINLKRKQQTQEFNQLNSQIENKEKEISSLNDTNAVNKIQKEINNLYLQSNELILAINTSNQELEQNNNTKNQNINKNKLLTYLIASLDNSISNIDNILKNTNINSTYYLNKIAEQVEKNTDKLEEKNIETAEELSQSTKKNLQQQVEEEKLKTEANKTNNDATNKLLTPNLIRKLQTIFFPTSIPSILKSADNNQLPENIQQAIAVILSAEINDKKLPDLAHKQPYLGDNLNLEGADNPVAYGIILLMHNMEQLQDSLSKADNLQHAEEQEQELIQQMFEVQNKAERITFNSLNQSNISDFQRRNQA